MPTLRLVVPGLVLFATVLVAAPARAQSENAQPLLAAAPLSASLFQPVLDLSNVDTGLDVPASQAADGAAQTSSSSEGRDCDGCPRRRPLKSFLDVTFVNVFYELANLGRGQVTAHITPKSWWANMQQGWVWDLDDFGVNQIGHPYQGNNYFNAGRSNGLSFWESAGLTAFGSGTWEYFGETNKASVNDLINTTLGGIALGEMFHRTAWLVRDTRLTGKPRKTKELVALAIDPVTGINRFISHDSSRVSDMPPEMVPSNLAIMGSTGVLWRGSNTNEFESTARPFLELDMLYGDPLGRSRTPYDAFRVLMRFGGGAAFSEATVRGRLLGQPFHGGGLQLNVSQDYDFNKNSAYQFGAQSFSVNVSYGNPISSGTSFFVSGWGGLTALGAVDSIPLTGKAPEDETDGGAGQGVSEGPRYYDYGPGSNFGATAMLRHGAKPIVVFAYNAHHIHSLDGVRANHFLQQLRADGMIRLKGALGAGVSGEYFDRRTFFTGTVTETKNYHFPQVRIFATWSFS